MDAGRHVPGAGGSSWETAPVRTAGVTEQQIDELVMWTLIRAAHRVERSLTELFAAYGLTPTQFGVLAQLATGESLTQAELARSILVRPQSIAELLDGMVERGLLVRTGSRGRGRPNPIALSEDGHHLLARVWPAVQAANDLTRLGFTPAQSAELNTRLHELLQRSGTDEPWSRPVQE